MLPDTGGAAEAGEVPVGELESPRFNRVLVLILGATGSTIVGRALNVHPWVVTAGELLKVEGRVAATVICSCGSSLDECRYWADALPLVVDDAGRVRSFAPESFDRIALALGGRVLVDTSKKWCWKKARWPWSAWDRRDTGFILMVRDPRGYIATTVRNGFAVDERIRRYLRWMVRQERFRRRAAGRALVVYYEDLCRDPTAELRRICEWIGIPPDPSMAWPGRHAHHLLSANTSSYVRREEGIRLDDRWRDELDSREIDRIERATAQVPWLRSRYAFGTRPPAMWRRFAFRLRCELERLGP